MNRPRLILTLGILASFAGCKQGGLSTSEVKRAAVDHAQQELGLPVGAALESTVWVGKEHDGQLTFCGTVSSRDGGPSIAPQRFAAQGRPVRFLVFEPAHQPFVRARPDKFVSWIALCGDSSRT